MIKQRQKIKILHVFGLWAGTGEPGENRDTHRENKQTPHKNTVSYHLGRKGGIQTGDLPAVRQEHHPLFATMWHTVQQSHH